MYSFTSEINVSLLNGDIFSSLSGAKGNSESGSMRVKDITRKGKESSLFRVQVVRSTCPHTPPSRHGRLTLVPKILCTESS